LEIKTYSIRCFLSNLQVSGKIRSTTNRSTTPSWLITTYSSA